mmetsp:Transcript_441/g.880  ORF Transcript_441/g.880 Transcript_441/m.880 type:complete len:94 (-) Transcript_441:83-364(-)
MRFGGDKYDYIKREGDEAMKYVDLVFSGVRKNLSRNVWIILDLLNYGQWSIVIGLLTLVTKKKLCFSRESRKGMLMFHDTVRPDCWHLANNKH